MSRLVRRGKKTPAIRFKALEIARPFGQKDYHREARAIHQFVRDHIRYVRDIRGVETLQFPEKTLEFGQGDCDDKSVLAASLLEAIGHPTRFVAIGFTPGQFAHVYVETRIGDKWYAVETTEPWEFGKSPPRAVVRMVEHN